MMDPKPLDDELGLYVHFPWCIKKCPYCDFNSHPLKDTTDQAGYLDALLLDWQSQQAQWATERLGRSAHQAFTSIFFGGGTPSLFEPRYLARLLSDIPHAGAEITLEVNPGTAEYHGFRDYASAGINRLSLGAQSFDDAQLLGLGRIHRGTETLTAFARARDAGFNNINIDLMWGLPGQSVASALADLQQAIDLEPEHLSWYQLTIEAKTEFAQRPPILPKDQILHDIELAGLELLAQSGYERYEVSGFAKDQRVCRHNLTYWSFGDYVGIGAGAHGKVTLADSILRTLRPSQPRLYLNDPCAIPATPVAQDQLTLEFMMNALRLTNGVPFATYSERTGLAWETVARAWQDLVQLGLVRSDRCATTDLGLRYLDSVLEKFIETSPPHVAA
jgi:putative oxygen-independent coproporphyrinogen III oxidase